MLRRSDGPNLSKSSSLRLCVAILFLISRSPADQSTFVGYPSEDYRRYSVDTLPPLGEGIDPPNMRRRSARNIKCFSHWIEAEPKEKWSLLYDTGGARFVY